MTTPARGADASDAATHLHLKRSEKFALLREAVAVTRFSRRGRHADVFAFIEKVELHTLSDGRCHLRQQDIASSLRWGADKLREVRDEAASLGWCEVIDACPTCGNRKTVFIRIDWPKIQATARRKRPGCMPENPARKADCPVDQPDNPASHIRNSYPHEIPKNEPHEVFRSEEAWPKAISREQLRSAAWLQRHFELAVRLRYCTASEVDRLEFFTCARVALLKGRNPGALFTSLHRKPRAERQLSDRAEQEARKMIRDFDRGRVAAPSVPTAIAAPHVRADRDSFAAAEAVRQADHLKLKYQLHEKQQAGAAGPGLLSDSDSGVADVDAASVGGGLPPVNPIQ